MILFLMLLAIYLGPTKNLSREFSKLPQNVPGASVKPVGESAVNPGVPGQIESRRPPDSRLSVKGYSLSGAFAPDQITSLRTVDNAP